VGFPPQLLPICNHFNSAQLVRPQHLPQWIRSLK
jgi:hypothetical protein